MTKTFTYGYDYHAAVFPSSCKFLFFILFLTLTLRSKHLFNYSFGMDFWSIIFFIVSIIGTSDALEGTNDLLTIKKGLDSSKMTISMWGE